MNKEFHAVFQLSRKIIFEVKYYTLGNNKNPHFSTSAAEFNQPKTDYRQCGQAQEELTKNFKTARTFYRKWDVKHLHDLTEEEYKEMREDMRKLEAEYNCMLIEGEGQLKNDFHFYEIKEFSKQKVK